MSTKHKYLIPFIILLIILALTIKFALAADFVPSGHINGRGVYKIYNFTNISAVKLFQNGNLVLDNTSSIPTSNYSSFANYSTYANYSDFANYSSFANYSTYAGQATYWATVQGYQSKWFYNSGNILTLNETELNSSIAAKIPTNLSHFVDDLGNRGYTSLSNFSNDMDFANNTYVNDTYIKITDEADLNVNSSVFWNGINLFSSLNYQILSYWENITGRPTHLSNFTDDLGNRGYSALSNFTNDIDLINSSYGNLTYLKVDDQRYNDSAINTTANIMNLGFLNSSYISSTYLNSSSDLNFSKIVNGPVACPSGSYISFINFTGGSTTCSQPPDTTYTAGVGLELSSTTFSVNNTYLQIYNNSAINTTANIQSLGFNTTSQLDTLYYALNNPYNYLNSSSVGYNKTAWDLAYSWGNHSAAGYLLANDQRYNNTAINTTANIMSLGFYNSSYSDSIYLNQSDQRYNDSAIAGVCGAGEVVQNITLSGPQCVLAGTGTVSSIEAGLGLTGGTITSTGTIAINETFLQSYNDSAINTTANIMSLGFYNDTASIANFVNRSLWTSIDNYPSACSAGEYVTAIGDTLTCSTPTDTTYSAGLGLELSSTTFSVNNTYLQIYNDSAINTTANIMSLGFHNSTYSDTLYIAKNSNATLNELNFTNNGTILDNSTCLVLSSPDGNTKISICN